MGKLLNQCLIYYTTNVVLEEYRIIIFNNNNNIIFDRKRKQNNSEKRKKNSWKYSRQRGKNGLKKNENDDDKSYTRFLYENMRII